MRRIDLSGKRFGRLTILPNTETRTDSAGAKRIFWLCQCDCGTMKYISANNLTQGHAISCGCYRKEKFTRFRHESRSFPSVAQSTKSNRLYRIFLNMHHRCANPKLKAYYNKGITVCKEWNDYANFHTWAMANGYADNLTIDRIDNNEGYYPGNCRWVDTFTQANNRTNNRPITFQGETKNLSQWARDLNISKSTLARRLRNGWSIENALTIKPSIHNSKTIGEKV